ncbi:hypothetical protein SCOR_35155 [Sulfidibacter corallicola]
MSVGWAGVVSPLGRHFEARIFAVPASKEGRKACRLSSLRLCENPEFPRFGLHRFFFFTGRSGRSAT